MMLAKVSKCGRTVWSHKKKIVFFSGLGAWGLNYLNQMNNEQILRSSYARKAESYGAMTIEPDNVDYVPPKLHVFIDKSDSSYLKNLASFQKNVLPLLVLAGFDVVETNAFDADELRTLSQAEDVRKCSGVAVVGSESSALPAVLAGLVVDLKSHKDRAPLAVFDPADYKDVNARCRKAMRIFVGLDEPEWSN